MECEEKKAVHPLNNYRQFFIRKKMKNFGKFVLDMLNSAFNKNSFFMPKRQL